MIVFYMVLQEAQLFYYSIVGSLPCGSAGFISGKLIKIRKSHMTHHKLVIITGASSGIGAQTAKVFSAAGYLRA